jgi:uncharacterized protein YoxC
MSEKKDFIEKQKAQIKEWSKQIDELKRKAQKVQVDASVKVENYIDDLHERLEEVRLKVEDIGRAADNNWEHLKSGVDGFWDDIKQALDRAKSRFNL